MFNTLIIVTLMLIISPYNAVRGITKKNKNNDSLMAIVASCHYKICLLTGTAAVSNSAESLSVYITLSSLTLCSV